MLGLDEEMGAALGLDALGGVVRDDPGPSGRGEQDHSGGGPFDERRSAENVSGTMDRHGTWRGASMARSQAAASAQVQPVARLWNLSPEYSARRRSGFELHGTA
jgi:hypothetical protein